MEWSGKQGIIAIKVARECGRQAQPANRSLQEARQNIGNRATRTKSRQGRGEQEASKREGASCI